MISQRGRLFTILIIFFMINPAFAQTKRPKIGLVLSGGGAKGIAHIGVLKAMEEAGLTPDYITGTSMGSIVGGLYAIGYSADELKAIVENADWNSLLTNKIPLDKVTFEEKFYYGRYLAEFFMENKKVQLPKGIIEGQALTELFSNLTRPVHGITDFNDFPIPFACVGSNIVTGEPVVLNKGSLALAMRASMAIPSIFTPVKIDDNLLVDGGLVRNMPVAEVMDMGADIVIGVFVSSDLEPEENLNSVISVLSQSAFITSAFDTRKQMEACNYLIVPNLEGFSTGSFQSASQILERGNEAGQEYYPVFKALADSLREIGPLHEVMKPVIQDHYIISSIDIEGNKIVQDEFITGKIRIKIGDTTSITHIEERLQVIFGTQYFEKLWYELLGDNGNHSLKIHVVERPKTQFRFSYHYDSENKGGIVGNVTLRNLVLDRSRLIMEADLSSYPLFFVDYFKYTGKNQNAALSLSGLYSDEEFPIYDSLGNVTDIFVAKTGIGGIKLQATRVQNSTYGIQVDWTTASLKPKVTGDILRSISKINYSNTLITLFHQYNSFNQRYFPTKGVSSNVRISRTSQVNGKVAFGDTLVLEGPELDGILDTDNIISFSVDVEPIIQISSKFSLLTRARMSVSTIGANTLNLLDYDYIGGFLPGQYNSTEYYGAGLKEFITANYFYGRLGLQYNPVGNLFIQVQGNYLDAEYPMKWFYQDAEFTKLGDRNRRFGYGGMLALKTPVGPIAIALAKDHYRSGWYSSLIIGFIY